MFLLVPAYPGCPGSKAVKRSLLYCSDQYAGEPGELLKCQVTQPHYVGVRIPPPREKGQFWRDTSQPLVQYMEYAS